MKQLFAIAVVLLLTSCVKTPEDPLCAVLANPSAFATRQMTLNGVAGSYKQHIGLHSAACPSKALLLVMSKDGSLKASRNAFTPTLAFLNQVSVLRATGASVYRHRSRRSCV
ncbi:hypothetical protein [Lysobacter claricitrinus]|uniref:hypothetical protein n=1 Tax=Lysobacter claricitrinus TaxID=3367728 RepID=UPI0038B3F0ED